MQSSFNQIEEELQMKNTFILSLIFTYEVILLVSALYFLVCILVTVWCSFVCSFILAGRTPFAFVVWQVF